MSISKYLQTMPSGDSELPYQLVTKSYSHASQTFAASTTGDYFSTAEKANQAGKNLSRQLFLPHLLPSDTAIIGHPSDNENKYTILKVTPNNEISVDRSFVKSTGYLEGIAYVVGLHKSGQGVFVFDRNVLADNPYYFEMLTSHK